MVALFFCNHSRPAVFSAHQLNLKTMKTLPALAFLAALVAFVLLPLRFETTGMILFAAGFAAIAVGDYARKRRPLRVSAFSAPVVAAPGRKERFGLAA